jgi:hypothetical protein
VPRSDASFAVGLPASAAGQFHRDAPATSNLQGAASFCPGPAGLTTQPPPAGLSTQHPSASSFAGCTTQLPQGVSTSLPPGLAEGKSASFAASSIASQAGTSFRTVLPDDSSFALNRFQSSPAVLTGPGGKQGLQAIRE